MLIKCEKTQMIVILKNPNAESEKDQNLVQKVWVNNNAEKWLIKDEMRGSGMRVREKTERYTEKVN